MPKKLHQVIGQRSRIKHHGITHVDNIYWIRGVERRMSSVPKGKGRRKVPCPRRCPKGKGLCWLQGWSTAEKVHRSIDVEIGMSRQCWQGYPGPEWSMSTRGGRVVRHPSSNRHVCRWLSSKLNELCLDVCPSYGTSAFLHTWHFLPWSSFGVSQTVRRIPGELPRCPCDSCPPPGILIPEARGEA